jgi:hypothetical protein
VQVVVANLLAGRPTNRRGGLDGASRSSALARRAVLRRISLRRFRGLVELKVGSGTRLTVARWKCLSSSRPLWISKELGDQIRPTPEGDFEKMVKSLGGDRIPEIFGSYQVFGQFSDVYLSLSVTCSSVALWGLSTRVFRFCRTPVAGAPQ